MKTSPFQPGDLLVIKHPHVTPAGKGRFYNRFSGGRDSLRSFKIEGICSKLPFGNVVVRRRFVYMGHNPNEGELPVLYMYDNYKPEYLGKGYKITCSNFDIFERVGKIIDARKLPAVVQAVAETKARENSVSFTGMNMQGMTRLEKIELYNSSPALIHHEDQGIKYALLMAEGHTCGECDTWLTSTNIEVVGVERFNIRRIKNRISKLFGQYPEKIHIFPAGYWCKNCGMLSVFAHHQYYDRNGPYTFTFDLVYVGEAAEYLKSGQ